MGEQACTPDAAVASETPLSISYWVRAPRAGGGAISNMVDPVVEDLTRLATDFRRSDACLLMASF